MISVASKRVRLTLGKWAIVDAGDFQAVSKFKWHAYRQGRLFYASCDSSPSGKMHRFILGVSAGVSVDHKNGNGLDNRRSNLRLCTKSQNAQNSRGMRRGCASRYKGVVVSKSRKKWRAIICAGPPNKNGYAKQIYLGTFEKESDAAKAYDSAAVKYFGEFASTNFKGAL